MSPLAVAASIQKVGPQICRERPDRMPLLSIHHKAVGGAVAEQPLSKPEHDIEMMVFWDHVSLGVAEAAPKDAVWGATERGRRLEEPKLYATGARYYAAGCLCGDVPVAP